MSTNIEIAGDLLLNIRGLDKAQREIENTVDNAATDGLEAGIKKTAKKLKSEYSTAMLESIRIGHKEQAKNLEDEFQRRQQNIKDIADRIKNYNRAIDAVTDRNEKARLRERKKALEDEIRVEQRAQDNLIKDRKEATADLVKIYDEGMRKAARNFEDKAGDAADSFADKISSALTFDNMNPDDLIKNLGKGLKDSRGDLMFAGKGMMSRGAAMGGKMGSVVSLLGKGAMALGAAAGTIAAVATAIAAIVGVMALAYGKVKEWNKSILEAVPPMDILGSETDNLSDRLHVLRKAMSQTSRRFNIGAEEAMKFIGALNDAGVTVRELKGYTDATNSLQGYNRAMNFAIKYTTALGISAEDLGQMQHRMLDNFGMRLNALDESMMDFGKMAQMAGMNSRGFVAAIMEGTANMALYNFRLADTAELLVGLTDILGEDMAKSMLSMEGVFKNMSTQDRYKAAMVGGGVMENVLQAGARRQIEGRAQQIGMDNDMLRAFRQAGLIGADREFDIEKLASLQGLELGRVQEQIAKAVTASGGDGDAAVRSLEDLTMQARLLTGGATTGEKADAMGAMDRPTEIAAKVAQGLGMMGAEDFGDITGVARMQFEQLTGIMGEEFEATKEIFNRAQARLAEQEGRDVTLKETLEALSADPGSLLTDEQIEKLSTTPSGDPMMDIAKQTLMATQTVGDLLGGQISGALNWIGGGVTSMTNAIVNEFMGFVGNNADAREAIEEAQNKTVELGGELSSLQEQLRAEEAKGGEGDTDKIAQLEADIEQTERIMDAYAQMQSDIQAGVVGAEEGRRNFLVQAYGEEAIMSQVRDSVLSGEGVQPGGAITNAARIGQVNSRGERVNYSGLAYESGYLNGGISGGWVENAPMMRDGEHATTGQIAFETALNSGGDMMEFMEKARKEDQEQRANQERAEEQAAIVNRDQLKEQEKIESGIRETVRAIRDLSNEEQADLVSGLISSSGASDTTGLVEKVRSGARGAALAGLVRLFAKDGGGTQITQQEAATLRALGVDLPPEITVEGMAQDFVYRGGANGGTITPINSADEFLGMKPTGAVMTALRGAGVGGGVVIHNLTINESGDAQETLRMVKRAIAAREGTV